MPVEREYPSTCTLASIPNFSKAASHFRDKYLVAWEGTGQRLSSISITLLNRTFHHFSCLHLRTIILLFRRTILRQPNRSFSKFTGTRNSLRLDGIEVTLPLYSPHRLSHQQPLRTLHYSMF